jgi:histidine triad (HIT) family protein
MSSCIFCSIVRGEVDSVKVYESDKILVIMDKQPITNGHMLVIPKKHAELLTELDDDSAGEMFKAAKYVAKALKVSKLRAGGVNYLLADGAEAGQEVYHAHLHVIPRYRNDGFYLHMPAKYDKETTKEDLENAAGKIRAKMVK